MVRLQDKDMHIDMDIDIDFMDKDIHIDMDIDIDMDDDIDTEIGKMHAADPDLLPKRQRPTLHDPRVLSALFVPAIMAY